MNSFKQIKWGVILSYLSIAINICSGLFYTPWMVATVGDSQYGLYTLANSVITLFLVDFGLSSATSRYLAKYNAENDRESAEQFLGAVYKLYLLMDAVILTILLAVFFLMDRIFLNLTFEELARFRVVYAISALFSVINFPCVTFNGILTAYERFIPLKIADLLYRVCNVGLAVIALLLGYGLYALVTIHAVVGLLILVVKYAVIRKTIPLKVNFKKTEKGIYKELLGFSIWVTVSALAARLVFNITPSILGIVASSAAIAVFGIVMTIEGYAFTITTAINGLFMPQISRIVVGTEENADLNILFLRVGKFQYFLNGAIVAGFTVVGESFIRLWMGEVYITAYGGILLVLIPGLFYNALEIANTTMTVKGKVKLIAVVSLVTGFINIVLSLPFSKKFGVIGACVSICIAYLVRSVLCNFIYHKVLPLDIPRFIKECYIRMSIPILVTVACGCVINCWIPDVGWGIFLLKAFVTVLIYLLAVLLLGLTTQEKRRMLDQMIKER